MKKGEGQILSLKLIHELKKPLVSAASGLVLVDGRFHVVADDELSLFSFSKSGPRKFEKQKLFPGTLPREKLKRKALKPDLESLIYVSSLKEIICVPSGSKENRVWGAGVSNQGAVRKLDFSQLYRKLRMKFRELNIEGAVLVGERVRLFQRGNGKCAENATIDVEWKSGKMFSEEFSLRKIREYDLGHVKGVPYTFTDAGVSGRSIWFLAVAEDTENPVLDGEILGSFLGRMNFDGKILSTHPLNVKSKPEGLCISGSYFYLVTDDDDRSVPARLFRGTLPR